jgi:hypothetical protein
MHHTIMTLRRLGIMGTLRVLTRFYRNYVAATLSITAICLYTYMYLHREPYVPLLLFKLLTDLVVFYAYGQFRGREYIYYYNLGFSKALLWGFTLGMDLAIYILVFHLFP